MSKKSEIRKKSLWAMKAVTAGALLFAGVSCSGETDDSNDSEWNIQEGDAGADASPSDTAVADADNGDECYDGQANGNCPEHCTMDDDVDCCIESGGDWFGDGCAVAVPGPFVPPKMTA